LRNRNPAKLCHKGVIPIGTDNAATRNVSGAAHIVERCTRWSAKRSYATHQLRTASTAI
jgi:hypothetical protein